MTLNCEKGSNMSEEITKKRKVLGDLKKDDLIDYIVNKEIECKDRETGLIEVVDKLNKDVSAVGADLKWYKELFELLADTDSLSGKNDTQINSILVKRMRVLKHGLNKVKLPK